MYLKSQWILGKVSRVKTLDKREENLYQLIDGVANRYGCLPSEFISKGDTLDLEVYLTISNLMDRNDKIKNNQPLTDTYDKEHLEEIYYNVTGKKPTENKSEEI